MREQLDLFGRAVIERVRDKSLDVTAKRIETAADSPSMEWLAEFESLSPRQRAFVQRLLRLQTDQVIAEFLGLFEDNRSWKLLVTNADGVHVDAVEHGDDVTAAPFGRRGWIATFSKYPPEGE